MSSDYQLEDTLYLPFTTRAFGTGIPTALVSGVIDIYEDVTATPIITAETLTVSLNGHAGFNMITVAALAASGFEAGKSYTAILDAGTVDSVSVIGEVVAHFTLDKSGAAKDLANATDGLGALKAETALILADTGTDGVVVAAGSKTGYALSATGLDAIVSTATGMVAIAKAIWDRVLTGATHNIANSAGRRLRIVQESGSYQGGAVWIDTNNGTAGTTSFENGVDILPTDTIVQANTIAGNVGLVRFQVAPGSAITFPGAQTNEVWEGRDWTLALGSRDITGSFIFGATVTGIGTATGEFEFEECDLGAVTLDNDGHYERCSLGGTFTVGQVGTHTFHQCFTESAAAITIDFGGLGGSAVHLFDFNGEINFKNMAAGDTVHITGAGTITTETCTAGTIEHDGFFEYTDAGGNITEVQSDIKDAVDAIKVPTDKMVFTKANELDSNTKSINDSTVTGTGEVGTPWDGP